MFEGRKLELATTPIFILRSDDISLKEGSIKGMKGKLDVILRLFSQDRLLRKTQG